MRLATREIHIGDCALGGSNPIRLQSMTNTPATDIKRTVNQIIQIAEAGADMVRLAITGKACIAALPAIRKELKATGFQIPLIADVHFRPQLALAAAPLVEKIRINPGNYSGSGKSNISSGGRNRTFDTDKEQAIMRKNLAPLVGVCKAHGTAIRIGTNMGSISPRIVARYGRSSEALVESTIEFLDAFNDLGFNRLVVSIKASQATILIQANRLLVRRMSTQGPLWPIHLGLTEAGAGEDARCKSALGIISLLKEGIGDTIRVSLTEEPAREIVFAKKIIALHQHYMAQQAYPDEKMIRLISTLSTIHTDTEELIIAMSIILGHLLLDNPDSTYWQAIKKSAIPAKAVNILDSLMHAAGIQTHKTDFIACPSCARTSFDIEAILHEAQQNAGQYPGLKIAIMGCHVNGPGEMADADFGLMGHSDGTLWLYQGRQVIKKHIKASDAVAELIRLIESSNHHNSM